MAEIRITYPGGEPRMFTLPSDEHQTVTMGRHISCDFHVPIASLSNLHCSIEKVGDDYYLTDENSTNGVLVDGHKATQTILKPGTSYLLGEAILVYIPDGGASIPKAEAVEDVPATTAASKSAPDMKEPQLEATAENATINEEPADAPDTPSEPERPRKKRPSRANRSSTAWFGPWSKAQIIFAIIATLLAFYAGLTLHHAIKTGEFLPAKPFSSGK